MADTKQGAKTAKTAGAARPAPKAETRPRAQRWAPVVVRARVTPRVPDMAEIEELFQCRLPLCTADAVFELRGVPTAVVNGLRRVIIDEVTGYALQVGEGGFRSDRTTELFMLPQMVNPRIELMPLWQPAAEAAAGTLRLELNVENATAAPRVIYAGDLRVAAGAIAAPLFNPTFELAVLQPGKTLVIEDITVAAGRGHAMFHVACRAAFRHLDLAQHSDAEVRLESGRAADQSGYVESCLVTDPRHHELRFTLPATTEASAEADARRLLRAGCDTIRARLRLVLAAVDEAAAQKEAGPALAGAMQFAAIQLESGLAEGVLQAPGETHTVGELLRRAIFDVAPDVAFAAYSVSAHERRLTLTVRCASDAAGVISEGAQMAIATMDEIYRSLE